MTNLPPDRETSVTPRHPRAGRRRREPRPPAPVLPASSLSVADPPPWEPAVDMPAVRARIRPVQDALVPRGPHRIIDRIGRDLLAAGGFLSMLIVAGIILVAMAFYGMLIVGFSDDPASTSRGVWGELAVAATVIGAIVLFLLWVLWRALRGGIVALLLTTFVGVLFTLFVARTWQVWQSGLSRPEDRDFLVAFILMGIPPVVMTLGSLIRLAARLGRQHP